MAPSTTKIEITSQGRSATFHFVCDSALSQEDFALAAELYWRFIETLHDHETKTPKGT